MEPQKPTEHFQILNTLPRGLKILQEIADAKEKLENVSGLTPKALEQALQPLEKQAHRMILGLAIIAGITAEEINGRTQANDKAKEDEHPKEPTHAHATGSMKPDTLVFSSTPATHKNEFPKMWTGILR